MESEKLAFKNLIKTPNLDHTKRSDWEYVYEPAEDTFLLLDALEQDLDFIQSEKPRIVLEVGSGSGLIITALSNILSSSSYCLAIDINQHACKLTKSTSTYNFCNVDVIQGDLTTFLQPSLVDLIVFNPPYVVTPTEEVNNSDLLTKSWAGGVDGTEIIKRFLDVLDKVLHEKSFGYLLLLKENQPDRIMLELERKHFQCKIIARRRLRGEELFIIKFIYQK